MEGQSFNSAALACRQRLSALKPWSKQAVAKRFPRSETRATFIEYALLAALIVVAIVTAVTSVGASLNRALPTVAGKIH
jgi:pilus assembly protein Flp/PilA